MSHCTDCAKYRQRIRELEQRLAELDWRPITPENLPKVGDEIGGWFGEECAVLEESAPVSYESYMHDDWTHFRFINLPAKEKP